jgi:hypothetical protein
MRTVMLVLAAWCSADLASADLIQIVGSAATFDPQADTVEFLAVLSGDPRFGETDPAGRPVTSIGWAIKCDPVLTCSELPIGDIEFMLSGLRKPVANNVFALRDWRELPGETQLGEFSYEVEQGSFDDNGQTINAYFVTVTIPFDILSLGRESFSYMASVENFPSTIGNDSFGEMRLVGVPEPSSVAAIASIVMGLLAARGAARRRRRAGS